MSDFNALVWHMACDPQKGCRESLHANREKYPRCTVKSTKQDAEKVSHLYLNIFLFVYVNIYIYVNNDYYHYHSYSTYYICQVLL